MSDYKMPPVEVAFWAGKLSGAAQIHCLDKPEMHSYGARNMLELSATIREIPRSFWWWLQSVAMPPAIAQPLPLSAPIKKKRKRKP